ncbi:hypothetical protein RB9050 [Rhodopirellula baltica SH 1]|uniref:Uncharacterized protein n=1 Tax=Rhodopirellula baltica (strain DSM 10527 / NCIMB 13988 / SH1) TaxID=243090 RepID=Q7UM59_RHOBA|nr:hypothetical protein RB9050 [Rhodopirellula baltica SH 1]
MLHSRQLIHCESAEIFELFLPATHSGFPVKSAGLAKPLDVFHYQRYSPPKLMPWAQ